MQWNIQISGHYPNCDSADTFIRICFCIRLISFDNFINFAGFLLIFLNSEDMQSAKLRVLVLSFPSNLCFGLYQVFLFPIVTATFSYLRYSNFEPILKLSCCCDWDLFQSQIPVTSGVFEQQISSILSSYVTN